jgi:predicted lipid-binding transport protein (Tim44 family)
MIQILILAAVAAFLFWRLSLVLGVRTGFEKPLDIKVQGRANANNVESEISSTANVDEDISDYVELDSDSGQALKEIKSYEQSFSVQNFVSGAKAAYEIILMAFENGDLKILEDHLAPDVYEDFKKVVTDRINKGFFVDASFGGLREIRIRNVSFDKENSTAEITVFFKCELTSVVKDNNNKIVEGSSSKVKTHTDTWTFGRTIGSTDPSWKLVATGE